MESDKFVVKDSGQREEFKGGMVRDTATGKTDFSLPLNGPMFERWASHLTKGATKYPDTKPGSPNWMLASGDEELVRFKKSACRHFIQWLRGDVDEDHAAAVFFNINGACYVEDKLKAAEYVKEKLKNEKHEYQSHYADAKHYYGVAARQPKTSIEEQVERAIDYVKNLKI